jgi:hypothetical protein
MPTSKDTRDRRPERREEAGEGTAAPTSLLERVQRLWRENPLPPPSDTPADKAFFNELSGEDEYVASSSQENPGRSDEQT